MAKRKPRWRFGGRADGGATQSHWLYGTHPILAALANPERRIRRLVATAEASASLALRIRPESYPGIDHPGAEILLRAEVDRLLPPGAASQGVAALVDPLPVSELHHILARTRDAASAVVVVLDQPNDPQNVGAVLRSAAAFAASALVLPKDRAPEPTGALAKAASGALERVPLVAVTNLARALAAIKDGGYWVVGLDPGADRPIHEVDMNGKIALVIGSEGAGLRRLTRESCDHLARIPIALSAESLNLSAAAAIALHEWSRRRNAASARRDREGGPKGL